MEDAFSANSQSTIEKKIDLSNKINLNNNEILDLEFYFEINQISEWITKNQFKKVALQFPDELLNYSVKVCSKLKEKCTESIFFILADTSYGSCCVDLVAAEHYNADSIIHFGHSCLSDNDKLPVLLVFDKQPLDLELVKSEINRLLEKNHEKKIIVLYDVSFYYLYEKMISMFSEQSQVFLSKICLPTKETNDNKTETDLKILFSRILPNDLITDATKYSFFYIGSNQSFLNLFLFYFNKCQIFQYDPLKVQNTAEEILFSKTNRELMKRYFLIEKARDSRIFGILIGTMSVSKYKQAIEHVSNLLKKANKRYYSFLIGKLNCPKLNNFLEVDTYVLIACNENSLINSKELNKPIITIYELEMAFNCSRLWGQEYVIDYRQLLEGSEHYLPVKISDQESDISLITGEARVLKVSDDSSENETSSSLINRDKALSVANYSPASDFLKNRSWTGLEQNLGKTEVTKAVEGKKGIAAGYDDELN